MRALLGIIFLLLFIVAVLGLLDVLTSYMADVNYTVEQKLFIITLFAVLLSVFSFAAITTLILVYETRKGVVL
jgi:hypothetical protein